MLWPLPQNATENTAGFEGAICAEWLIMGYSNQPRATMPFKIIVAIIIATSRLVKTMDQYRSGARRLIILALVICFGFCYCHH